MPRAATAATQLRGQRGCHCTPDLPHHQQRATTRLPVRGATPCTARATPPHHHCQAPNKVRGATPRAGRATPPHCHCQTPKGPHLTSHRQPGANPAPLPHVSMGWGRQPAQTGQLQHPWQALQRSQGGHRGRPAPAPAAVLVGAAATTQPHSPQWQQHSWRGWEQAQQRAEAPLLKYSRASATAASEGGSPALSTWVAVTSATTLCQPTKPRLLKRLCQ